MGKKLVIAIIVVILAIAAGILAFLLFQKEEPINKPAIYVSIVTHNEEPRAGTYPDFVNNGAEFQKHREAIVSFAKMLWEEGVKYNYQSDWNFLLAATLYDKGSSSTNGKNFLRYLKEDLGFEIDPHAHETQYNYADVAYLISRLGVAPSHIVGGFLAYPSESSKVEYFRDSLKGAVYPGYAWKAEVLWGAGSANHIYDESIAASGIWKPKSNENLLVNYNSALLPYIGGYYPTSWQGLNDLLEKQKNGKLEEGRIYTQTIFAGQIDMVKPGYIEDFRKQVKSLSEYAGAELIKWVGLQEVFEIWKTEFNSEPSIYKYASEPAQQGGGAKRDCGNGVCEAIEKRTGACQEDCW